MSGRAKTKKKKKNVYVLNLAEISLIVWESHRKRSHDKQNKQNPFPFGHWLLSFISILESSCQVKARSHCRALSGCKATAKGTFNPF